MILHSTTKKCKNDDVSHKNGLRIYTCTEVTHTTCMYKGHTLTGETHTLHTEGTYMYTMYYYVGTFPL